MDSAWRQNNLPVYGESREDPNLESKNFNSGRKGSVQYSSEPAVKKNQTKPTIQQPSIKSEPMKKNNEKLQHDCKVSDQEKNPK